MKKINQSQFAILGFLANCGPLSGYDIRKITQDSTAHFWQESIGHIYPTLTRMLKAGFIREAGDQPTDDKRQKKMFEITPLGEEAFQDWMRQPAKHSPARCEIVLKLYFGSQVSADILVNHLKRDLFLHQEELRELQRSTEIMEQSDLSDQDKLFRRMTLDYGIKSVQAHMGWLEHWIEELK